MTRPTLDRPLIECPNFAAVHALLHRLWGRAKDQPGYVKREWMDLDNAIVKLATDGPGAALPGKAP